MITIDVRRWSTDQERDMLRNTLAQGGEDKLLAALQNIRPPVGYISTPGTMGYDLYYARKNVLPNGDQQIVIATNRRVAMGEVASSTATMNYRFNVIEMHLDAGGNGVGKMAPFSRVAWNAQLQKIEISDWSGDMPVDFEKVTTRPN